MKRRATLALSPYNVAALPSGQRDRDDDGSRLLPGLDIAVGIGDVSEAIFPVDGGAHRTGFDEGLQYADKFPDAPRHGNDDAVVPGRPLNLDHLIIILGAIIALLIVGTVRLVQIIVAGRLQRAIDELDKLE